MPKHVVEPLGFAHNFFWHGERINDVAAWCRVRGEQMIVVEFRRREPNLYGSQMVETKEIREMPESFWNCLRVDINKDGIPREIRRYSP